MIAKLLSLLSTAKGAAAATVIAAAGVTGGVAATNQDVQTAVSNAVQTVTQTTTSTSPKPSNSNQPAVVAARNDADKKLRDAFQNDQQTLEKLHSTKVQSADRAKLDDLVNSADAKLRDRLTTALNDVAALTLGRNGLEASASPKLGDAAKTAASPDLKVSFTPDAQAKIDAIVKTAITDMDKLVSDAELAIGALPTFEPGKPSDLPGGKPGDVPSGRPDTAPTAPARPSPTR
jgi:hypothetical protein